MILIEEKRKKEYLHESSMTSYSPETLKSIFENQTYISSRLSEKKYKSNISGIFTDTFPEY